MMNHNEEATDQLEEVSGRWLRDQLRDVADVAQSSPDSPGRPAGDASTAQLIDGLASSISAAVTEPIRGLESRREAQQKKLEESIQELSGKLGDAFLELAKVRDQGAANTAQAEEARSEAKREIEAVRTQAQGEVEAVRTQSKGEIEGLAMEMKGEINAAKAETRRDLDQLGTRAADLRSSFNSLAEEIGRLQEKVREQQERIEALRFRETQRAKAMSELARASSSLREAVAVAAAMSGENEDESGSHPPTTE